ncbi:hypothetical protein H7J06_05460 [Mycobacterium hodleri]|uniref:hypothetical protein n=1 Tax=Mycolicibacterium hodleri TaxID=49897 RepID=UPI0021F3AFDB|nr:hypothetical protein [Mycolicibacterium hodleri]MCV7132426.1 hypothetical protein [Mycolicibacterium hodleri]
MEDPIAEASIEAAEHGAPPKVWHAGPEAVIQLADGNGHLLTGATVTAWELPDVMTGRSE